LNIHRYAAEELPLISGSACLEVCFRCSLAMHVA
jgi:hypothetical protein